MRRRTNKSSKVPNVKLRPAPNNPLRRTQSEHWADDSQLGSDDTAVLDLCPRPFKGFVICATGIKDKPTLFRKALELGATSVTALTDRVTHLISESHNGAKYMCALERKIPIMKSSWVEESYQTWLRGDDVDMQETLTTHRLPVFSGVVLCLSGIADVERRVQIHQLVTQNGGTYTKNLERPVKVTHLLCSGDDETDKMRYAAKFNERKEAMIHLVWEEWFWDSLEFGGRFDETTYQVSRPRPERKVQQETVTSPPSSALPSEVDDNAVLAAAHTKQQTNFSSTQEDEEEMTSVKVLPAVTLQIWGSLLSRRGYQISGAELVRTNSAPAVLGTMDETPEETDPGKSVISSFRRANSFAPVKAELPEGAITSKQPFRRTSTNVNLFVKADAAAPANQVANGKSSSSSTTASPVAGPSKQPNVMFAGCKFCALGEAKTPAVKNAIESHGGRMVTESDEDVDFIIVRLVSGSKLFREEADQNLRSKYRTECWLERCIFEDQICPPERDVSFTPLAITIPIPNAENIVLSLSGLDQSESCSLRRLLRALGITLAPSFSRRTTHLLCPSGTGLKFEKAREWNIPVVNTSWLAEMSKNGNIPLVEEHLIPGSAQGTSESKFNLNTSIDFDIKGKGKRKAVPQGLYANAPGDTGSMMNDITNTDGSESPVELPREITKPAPKKSSHSSSVLSSTSQSFGQPGKHLREPPLPTRASSIASLPPRSETSPSVQDEPLQQDSPTQSDDKNDAPQPTWQELEHERLTAKIPSSRTPSPMKIPKTGSRASLSPVKINHEATKALQESITRALKRHTSEEDEVLNGGRNSKRQRPQRHKAPSRQISEQQIPEVPMENPIPLMPFAASSMSPFESFDVEGEVLPQAPQAGEKVPPGRQTKARRGRSAGGRGVEMQQNEEEEEGMRVLYEDPGQADERKKLMRLLKSEGQTQGGRGRGTPPKVVKAAEAKGGRRSMRTRKGARLEGF